MGSEMCIRDRHGTFPARAAQASYRLPPTLEADKRLIAAQGHHQFVMRLSSGSVSLMYLDGSNSYYIHLRIQLQSIGNVSSQNFRVSDSGEKKVVKVMLCAHC